MQQNDSLAATARVARAAARVALPNGQVLLARAAVDEAAVRVCVARAAPEAVAAGGAPPGGLGRPAHREQQRKHAQQPYASRAATGGGRRAGRLHRQASLSGPRRPLAFTLAPCCPPLWADAVVSRPSMYGRLQSLNRCACERYRRHAGRGISIVCSLGPHPLVGHVGPPQRCRALRQPRRARISGGACGPIVDAGAAHPRRGRLAISSVEDLATYNRWLCYNLLGSYPDPNDINF